MRVQSLQVDDVDRGHEGRVAIRLNEFANAAGTGHDFGCSEGSNDGRAIGLGHLKPPEGERKVFVLLNMMRLMMIRPRARTSTRRQPYGEEKSVHHLVRGPALSDPFSTTTALTA